MIRPSSPGNPILLLAPRQLLGSLISFEALVVLYMFAGIYKEDPRFMWIPVDLTGLFFALSVAVGSLIIVLNPIYKKGLPPIVATVCLVTWFLVSLTWSPSRVYGPEKVLFMGTLVLWAVIAGALIIAPDAERLRRLFTLLLLLSLWMGVEALLVYLEAGGQAGRIEVATTSYLAIGRVCGLGALVAVAAWLFATSRVTSWLCLGLFLGLGFILAISGGRGPLLATALPLLIPIALGIRMTSRKILYSPTQLSVLVLLVAIAGAFAVYSGVTGLELKTIERLEQLTEGDLRGSAEVRAEHYANAAKLWSEAPVLGQGAGSYPLLTGRGDVPRYPHNLFLELMAEGGIVALGLFGALVASALRGVSFERLRRDPQAACAVMLFANGFCSAMLSADLPDNRAMFMMIGVLALFAIRPAGAAAPAAARPDSNEGDVRSQTAAAWRQRSRSPGLGRADGWAKTEL